jgi:hypothetical protein
VKKVIGILVVLVAVLTLGPAVKPVESDTCISYGYLCDPRWIPDPVCCPGTHCISPYPGVPRYCL